MEQELCTYSTFFQGFDMLSSPPTCIVHGEFAFAQVYSDPDNMFAAKKKENQMEIRVLPSTRKDINALHAYLLLHDSRISDLSCWASMALHIAWVVVVKPTMQELKVTGFKKPIAMFSSLHVFASILQTNNR